jgi:hypothetical protein
MPSPDELAQLLQALLAAQAPGSPAAAGPQAPLQGGLGMGDLRALEREGMGMGSQPPPQPSGLSMAGEALPQGLGMLGTEAIGAAQSESDTLDEPGLTKEQLKERLMRAQDMRDPTLSDVDRLDEPGLTKEQLKERLMRVEAMRDFMRKRLQNLEHPAPEGRARPPSVPPARMPERGRVRKRKDDEEI